MEYHTVYQMEAKFTNSNIDRSSKYRVRWGRKNLIQNKI